MTRAIDTVGNTQPGHVPYNEKGYLFNQPLPHPIRVTSVKGASGAPFRRPRLPYTSRLRTLVA